VRDQSATAVPLDSDCYCPFYLKDLDK